jgi:hypothetical protein
LQTIDLSFGLLLAPDWFLTNPLPILADAQRALLACSWACEQPGNWFVLTRRPSKRMEYFLTGIGRVPSTVPTL